MSKEEELISAAYRGDIKEVETLIKKGVNINYQDGNSGFTALGWAVCKGHLDIVKYLLKHNADVNIKDCSGETVIQWVQRLNYFEIIELLRKHGCEEE